MTARLFPSTTQDGVDVRDMETQLFSSPMLSFVPGPVLIPDGTASMR
jgi:hypothetical protein